MEMGKNKTMEMKNLIKAAEEFIARGAGLLSGEKLELHEVVKDNGIVLHGIILKKEGFNACPNYYLENLENREIEDIDTELLEIVNFLRNESKNINLSALLSREYLIENVILRVVNISNKETLEKENIITYPVMIGGKVSNELIAYPCCIVDGLGEGLATFKIKEELLNSASVSAEEIYEAGLRRTTEEVTIKDMAHVICEMMGQDFDEFSMGMLDGPAFYVVSNKSSVYGAAALLCKDALKNLATELDGDLIILPSSVHEMICLKDDGSDPRLYKDMVGDVNSTVLNPEEFLSNKVFKYVMETGEIEEL